MVVTGALRESQQFLSRKAKLRELFLEDGYIFVRGVLNKGAVQRVRADLIRIAKRFAVVEKTASSKPIWSHQALKEDYISLDGPFAKSISAMRSLRELGRSKELTGLVRKVLNGDICAWQNNPDQVRVVPPGDFLRRLGHVRVATATPAHQDFYSFQSLDFCTVWIPLTEIDDALGGLALRRDSHKSGLCEHWWQGDVQLGVADTLGEANAWHDAGGAVLGGSLKSDGAYTWLRADYELGDVLIFHPMMLHRGLLNSSDQVRLSVDFRFQRKGTVAPWVAYHRAAYTVKFLEEAQQYVRRLTSDPDIAGKAWQRIREQGPRRGFLADRAAKIVEEVALEMSRPSTCSEGEEPR